MTSYPADCRRCTKPAARNTAGAFSAPAKNAAALDGAPIKAIFFGCRVIFAAKFAPYRTVQRTTRCESGEKACPKASVWSQLQILNFQLRNYLRGAAAMVANSGGKVKRTSSRIKSRSR